MDREEFSLYKQSSKEITNTDRIKILQGWKPKELGDTDTEYQWLPPPQKPSAVCLQVKECSTDPTCKQPRPSLKKEETNQIGISPRLYIRLPTCRKHRAHRNMENHPTERQATKSRLENIRQLPAPFTKTCTHKPTKWPKAEGKKETLIFKIQWLYESTTVGNLIYKSWIKKNYKYRYNTYEPDGDLSDN